MVENVATDAVSNHHAKKRLSVLSSAPEGYSLVSVTARKIRDHGRDHGSLGVGRVYAGYIIAYPSVGRGMVIFRDPNGHRMVTTPVRRMLGAMEGDKLYVETENSVYQLTFRGEIVLAPPRALASQAT